MFGLTKDDADRVQVVQQIIGNTVGVHTSSQSIGSGTKTSVVDLEDGLEEEDTTGLESAADIVNELVVVCVNVRRASCAADARLANVPESRAADALESTMGKDVSDDLENIAQVRSSRGLLDQPGVQVPQERREQQIQDGGDQVSSPVTNELGQVSGGNTSASTDVDQEVKPQHNTVDGLLGIDNDLLTILISHNMGDSVWGLIHDGRRDIGLELSRTDGKQIQGKGKGSDGVTRSQDRGQSRDNHDDMGKTTNANTPADHLETTVFCVGEPAKVHGQSIGHELEGLRHGSGGDRTLAKGTSGVLRACTTGSSRTARGKRSADEVLVDLVASIVGSTLGKLDGAQVITCNRQLSSYAAQSRPLLFGRKDESVEGIMSRLVLHRGDVLHLSFDGRLSSGII